MGGDARELEIVRLMLADGLDVRAIGLPAGVEAILGRPQEVSVGRAVAGAAIVLCPIPGLGLDDSIFAPHWPEKLYLGSAELADCARPGMVIMGTASPSFRANVASAGLALREYEQDDELMILRSRAIAEGALRVAIQNTDFTLHRAQVFLLGFGRSSVTLCEALLALGAHVTVAARNPVQLARAWEMGAEPLVLSDLAEAMGSAQVVFNTIPVTVVSEEILERAAKDVLIIDMSAPPCGVDHAAAERLGLRLISARGLGSRAPVTVGRSQWRGIRRIVAEELARV